MKIAIDARIISSSTGRYIERLIYYLEKLDTTNTYLILVRAKDKHFYTPENANFKVVVADFPNYSLQEQLQFAIFLYSLEVDLVHFCMPQQPLLYTKSAVTTVHDLNLVHKKFRDDMGALEFPIKKFVFRQLLRTVARRSRHVITPSEYTRRDLIQFAGINPNKVTVTLEGADAHEFAPSPVKKLQNKQFIMYVGRAEEYKNNKRLIEAQQQLLTFHPDLHLAIVGKVDELRQAHIDWVKKNKYKNVHFLGFVSDNELSWLYKNCQAYIFPSLMEGFGLPGLEAMSCNAVVVSSNATCLPEIYMDAAHYFDPYKTDDMAKAIDEVLTNPELQKRLRANATKVLGRYSWEKMAKQTLEIYKNALN